MDARSAAARSRTSSGEADGGKSPNEWNRGARARVWLFLAGGELADVDRFGALRATTISCCSSTRTMSRGFRIPLFDGGSWHAVVDSRPAPATGRASATARGELIRSRARAGGTDAAAERKEAPHAMPFGASRSPTARPVPDLAPAANRVDIELDAHGRTLAHRNEPARTRLARARPAARRGLARAIASCSK
jgi:hypothetical protein